MNDVDKWRYLSAIPRTDRWAEPIQQLCRALMAAALIPNHQNWQKRYVQLAQTVARDWIRQVTDTARIGREDIAGLTRVPDADDAIDALRRGIDDCDAKARLFVALCLAAGIPAEIVGYWETPSGVKYKQRGDAVANQSTNDRLYHVAAVARPELEWLPVELTLARARLGEWGEYVPKEADGKVKQAT